MSWYCLKKPFEFTLSLSKMSDLNPVFVKLAIVMGFTFPPYSKHHQSRCAALPPFTRDPFIHDLFREPREKPCTHLSCHDKHKPGWTQRLSLIHRLFQDNAQWSGLSFRVISGSSQLHTDPASYITFHKIRWKSWLPQIKNKINKKSKNKKTRIKFKNTSSNNKQRRHLSGLRMNIS